ncbi:calcium transporting ATpase or aminophospholipid transporter [Cryptosporidium ryanae]|uniref:calcium transporting ATpase or aminophospholipid transporter n=1 Tax=Cryptosporidium ryanae TaxID=515981 RepID=UPI00351A6E9C|nr:calcium transporting ATpase or aminophospholipid transporter [Cryptosporidium ryanae]
MEFNKNLRNERLISINNSIERNNVTSYKRLNVIKTARYSLLLFLPKNLYDQFSNVANIYFLAIGIMQMIPSISSSGGIPTIALPLLCMLSFSAAQAAYEDWKRHKADSEINNLTVYSYDPTEGNFVINKWGSLVNGDLVIVRNREIFPADMILLASSQHDNRVFVETASMDGETNLKLRESPRILFENGIKHISDVITIESGLISCGEPNDHPNRIEIESKFTIKMDNEDKELNFDCIPSNMLLRGCKLRNTTWALGVVVYTGNDTKIYQSNLRSAPHKMSYVKSLYNQVSIASFIFLLFICLSFGIFTAFIDFFGGPNWSKRFEPIARIPPGENVIRVIIVTFFTWIIVLANLIPIGMFFYLVISKVSQAIIITSDPRLSNQSSPIVRNSDLNDELGQISYICTDKTGTLTRNYMEFKVMCINGNVYGKRNLQLQKPENTSTSQPTPHVDIEDENLREMLSEGKKEEIELLLNFALNNTVLLQQTEDELIDDPPLYTASSTDEEAFVLTSHHFGISLYSQKCSKSVIKFTGIGCKEQFVEFETLIRLEFDHSRRRSSVLVKFPKKLFKYETEESDGYRYILFTKGSESAIRDCCNLEDILSENYIKTFDNATDFASIGYRTLFFAKKEFNEEDVIGIVEKYKKNGNNCSNEIIELLENNLVLQGCSGIEDLLQFRAQETIESLIASGIKVWILTGDRQETAVNIAIRVGLISEEMDILVLDEVELERLFSRDKDYKNKCYTFISKLKDTPPPELSNCALIIDSQILEKAFLLDEKKLAEIAISCASVVFARVTPKQKANVVKLIQEHTKQRVLAIGDGGNDCTMLQTANVGVGIHGSEGMQAYNVSDFGISQFCHLQPLVLIHGRLCSRRTSILVLYNLYKCFTLNIVSVYFGFASLFTGSKLFFELLFQLYNFLYTSIPPILFATFDSDIPVTLPYNYHEPLYLLGIRKPYLSLTNFSLWTLTSIYHAAISLFVPYFLLGGNNPVNIDGFVPDFWTTGLAVYINVVIIVNKKILLESYTSWKLVLISILVCALLFIVSIFLFPILFQIPELRIAAKRAATTPMFIITIIISVTLAISVDWIVKIYKRSLYPETFHLIQDKYYQIYKKKYESHKKLLLSHPYNWLESTRKMKKRKSGGAESIQIKRKSSDIIGYAFNSPDINISQLFLSNKTLQ